MMKYTSGPWIVNKETGAITAPRRTVEGRVSLRSGVALIGIVRLQPNGCEHGNAQLIELSPEMLETLRAVVRCADAGQLHGNDPAIVKARALIKRADAK